MSEIKVTFSPRLTLESINSDQSWINPILKKLFNEFKTLDCSTIDD